MTKNIIILGSSGSIGSQTLDVIAKINKNICVSGLAVNSNIDVLKSQIKNFKPIAVSVYDFSAYKKLKKWCNSNKMKTYVYNGDEGIKKLISIKNVDTVIAAMSGSIGLKYIIMSINYKKNIAIANKEPFVMAGNYIMKLAKTKNVSIIPIDSEHSAIFQCLNIDKKSKIRRIILTASGGPFYKYSNNFSNITVDEALNHPTWKMGKKITIDSATLMNKGFEIIEASILFGIDINKIDVLIHPQSIIHSMIEYIDGSIIAYISKNDMHIPIQYAITYPERINSCIDFLDFNKLRKLEFYEPEIYKFPCLKIAYDVAKIGYTSPSVMNAANEVAVYAFLKKEIKFTDISNIIYKTVKAHKIFNNVSLSNIMRSDIWAREYAKNLILKIKSIKQI
ncbi:MAG: 1-deoxy-D-xylulose-5-phosphate reductoisomerase [Endomicrobium sp.]|jgi:1-deoxy-D-xylulose-5-phosphate reductoisomerase|nr:1-deoxy-D-xylulose-5-phosphate reductoisomerase [Endomicrobium sp.]